jgi:ABC-type transporter Mla subunit MlaD
MATLVENILEGLRSEEGHLQGMLRNARLAMGNLVEITDRLLHGDGVFRKLIKDDKTSSQFDRALAKINSGLDQIAQVLDSTGQRLSQTQGALQDLQTLAANTNQTVREIVAVLRSQSDQVPGLLLQTQELLRQTTRTIESLQETWLLRDYVAPDEALRLSPADLTEP